MQTESTKNRLAEETSPYLLQHQNNPVDWYPWGDEALEKAKKENKLLLISIGYSACHWCHVMEHESFEDDSVAAVMNKHFVSIKVDREERPDVDQVYMSAVQLMTGRGGWPLNCFALPDGRPIFGGTYFQKEQWLDILENIQKTYVNDLDKVEQYADQLATGMQQADLIEVVEGPAEFDRTLLDNTVSNWRERLDFKEGGPNRAPKFPLPNNYQFLLRYASLSGDDALKKHTFTTLDKMAYGGIYDQIGGGFARYSTDHLWKVPHFEKMLYDNGQLISLYSEAYQASKKELYKQVVEQTFDWAEREMSVGNGAYYSALDADSEGEEGKFYVWTKEELQEVCGDLFPFVEKYYNINAKGRWEHGKYILLRRDSDEEFAQNNGIGMEELRTNVIEVNQRLMKARDKRIRPGLDDKSLTSWNALMVHGLADAYLAFGDERYLARALKCADFIWTEQRREDGGLNHSYKNGKSTINGYLEDYSFTIGSFIALYQVTLDETWLARAKSLTEVTIKHFSDELTGMFYFTSDLDPALISRKIEVDDNVIPASNSSMAKTLFYLGSYYQNEDYLERSARMLNHMKGRIPDYGGGYSNWAILALYHTFPFYEVVVCGKNAGTSISEFGDYYLPNTLFSGDTDGSSQLPLLEYKYLEGEQMIYVCVERSCQLPVAMVSEAIGQMR